MFQMALTLHKSAGRRSCCIGLFGSGAFRRYPHAFSMSQTQGFRSRAAVTFWHAYSNNPVDSVLQKHGVRHRHEADQQPPGGLDTNVLLSCVIDGIWRE